MIGRSGWACTLLLGGACAGRAHILPPAKVTQVPLPEPTAVPWLRADSPEAAEALRADAYVHEGPVAAGFLASAAHVSLEVSLPAQRCVAFVGRATVGMQDLDAALYLPDGTLLAEDEGADAEPQVQFCSDDALPAAYLVLRAYRGAGSYAVSRWSRPQRLGDPMLSSQELADGALRELGLARCVPLPTRHCWSPSM